MQANGLIQVENKDVRISGRFLKTARLNDEYYVPVEDPSSFIAKLAGAGVKADLFTFVQEIHDRGAKYEYHRESDGMAVLPLTTYENWWKQQINDKTRNMVRKAGKKGVTIQLVEFSDELVRSIMDVYNETPIRQGKTNWHYGKDFETIKREHKTFLDRSEFIGAFDKSEMIGFAKVTHSPHCSFLMNIVAKVAHRDKSPTNALIAKAVQICVDRKIQFLNYGIWGRRGLNDFKVASGFERFEIPRYFVPLNLKGKLSLKLSFHRGVKDFVPEKCIIMAAELRSRWNDCRHKNKVLKPGDVTHPVTEQGAGRNCRL